MRSLEQLFHFQYNFSFTHEGSSGTVKSSVQFLKQNSFLTFPQIQTIGIQIDFFKFLPVLDLWRLDFQDMLVVCLFIHNQF